MWERNQTSGIWWDGSILSMEGHVHFRYCTPSALAHLIIHGVWSSITFSMPLAVWPVWILSHRSCSAVSSVCAGWPQLPLGAEMRPCPHRSAGGSALPASVHTCMWTQEKHNIEHTVWEYYIIASLFSSLGSEFSSQGHFHSLQLLNVSQFLFCRVVRLKTAPRNNFSHT